MSTRLSIYLDDCSDDDGLIVFLSQAGYTVISPHSTGTSRADDPVHLEYAAAHDYVLLSPLPQPLPRGEGSDVLTYNPRGEGSDVLTCNPDDFEDLHDES